MTEVSARFGRLSALADKVAAMSKRQHIQLTALLFLHFNLDSISDSNSISNHKHNFIQHYANGLFINLSTLDEHLITTIQDLVLFIHNVDEHLQL